MAVKFGFHIIIKNSYFRLLCDINVTVDPCIINHVLVFNIAACCIMVHLGGNQVFACMQIICNIKLRRSKAVFVVTHGLTVNIQVKPSFHAVKCNNKTAANIFFVNCNRPHISADRVICRRRCRAVSPGLLACFTAGSFPWIILVIVYGPVNFVPLPSGILHISLPA